MTKENEMRERSKESKEKESIILTRVTRACAREELPLVIDVHTPPSLELLLAYAHHKCNFYDDTFTREWHRIMSDELMWCHHVTGEPVRRQRLARRPRSGVAGERIRRQA